MPNVTPWPSVRPGISGIGVRARTPRWANPAMHRTNPPTRGTPRRVGAGIRHYRRDVIRAPWSEDRIPGVRYDSLDPPSRCSERDPFTRPTRRTT